MAVYFIRKDKCTCDNDPYGVACDYCLAERGAIDTVDLRKLADDLRNEHAAVWHGGRTTPRAELWKAKGAKEAADRLETILNKGVKVTTGKESK